MLKLFAGDLEPEDLIASCEAEGRKRNAQAHYFVARRYLQDHERDEAMKHFEKCIDLGVFGDDVYYLARGHLDRMKRDGAWPNFKTE